MEPRWGNPVPGVIQAHEAVWDGVSFRVTKTFAQHAADGLGTDVGNGRCGAPVLAVADGEVVERRTDPANGALIIRIKHGDTGFSSGYAHMASFSVGFGTTVQRGAKIGVVGDTGAPGQCHVHFDISQGENRLDPWPRLEQNQEADMETGVTIYPSPRTWHTRAGTLTGRRLAGAPLTNSMTFDPNSPAEADAEVTLKPTPTNWPPGPYLRVTTGGMAGFLVAFADVDAGSPPLGAAAQIEAATAPLNAEIARLRAEITDLKKQLKSVRNQLAALTAGLPGGGP